MHAEPHAMLRIGLVGATPLLVQGLAGALAGEPGWALVPLAGPAPGEACDAYLLHVRDAAEAHARLAALPADVPAVLLGDGLGSLAAAHADARRTLALLGSGARPAQVRAALAAVLEGLWVHEAPWPGAADRRTNGRETTGAGPGVAPPLDSEPLTPRELEVFELIGKGLSNRDIGGVLGISAHTAKYHVAQILTKVGAATRAEAVALGLKLGLIGL